MSGYPWSQFRCQHWLSAMAACDVDARGVAITLYCMADTAPQRGFIVDADANPYSVDQLRRMLRLSNERMVDVLELLKDARLIAVDNTGRRYFPCMVKETAERAANVQRVKRHRNGDVMPAQRSRTTQIEIERKIEKETRQNTPPLIPQGQSAPPLRPEPAEKAERERPQGFDALIDNTRIKALCDAYPPSRGGRAYGVAARAVQVLADEKYGGDCNAATAFLAARVQAWAASAKGRDLAARGFMPAFGNWLRDKCYDEPDADWENVPAMASQTEKPMVDWSTL